MDDSSGEDSYDPNDPIWKHVRVVEPGNENASDDMCLNDPRPSTHKRPRLAGPMDNSFAENSMFPKKDLPTTRTEAQMEKLRNEACINLARWMYEAGIPFHVLNTPSFRKMCDAIAQYGPGYEPPTHDELAGPLLNQAIEDVKRKYVKPCEEEWAWRGCSLMVDSWTDDNGMTLINILVNSPRGSVFLTSIDVSNYAKSGSELSAELRILQLINRFVERVGKSNIVQVITDSSISMVLAGKLLENLRPNLYWAPCAARCINSILEKICEIPRFRTTLKIVKSINEYIYLRPGVLNMLKRFTGQKELVRAGITKFATVFLTLERMHLLKEELKGMFGSQEWKESEWVKKAVGERIIKAFLAARFWDDVDDMMKIYRPLVRVWRLVDGEKKPAMGYLYGAMDKAKEAIKNAFEGKEEKYKDVFVIIDKGWDCVKPLHAAAHYLNPVFFSKYKDGMNVPNEVANGFVSSVERLVSDPVEQEKITSQVCVYRRAEGLFGKNIAIRQRCTMSPEAWWQIYGCGTPELKKFAIKVLSLNCSAFGGELNWSIFENVHCKKRSRRAQQQLNNVVYVRYNRALKRRYHWRERQGVISLKDIDDDNEWLVGNMEEKIDLDEDVFEGKALTWDEVATAIGLAEELELKNAESKQAEKGKGKANENEEKEEVAPNRKGFFLGLGGVEECPEDEEDECSEDEEDECQCPSEER